MTDKPIDWVPRKFRCEQAANGGWIIYDATSAVSRPVAAFATFAAMLGWLGGAAVPGPNGDAA